MNQQFKAGDTVLCNGKFDIVIEYPFNDPQTDEDGGYDIVLKEQGTQMTKNCTLIQFTLSQH